MSGNDGDVTVSGVNARVNIAHLSDGEYRALSAAVQADPRFVHVPKKKLSVPAVTSLSDGVNVIREQLKVGVSDDALRYGIDALSDDLLHAASTHLSSGAEGGKDLVAIPYRYNMTPEAFKDEFSRVANGKKLGHHYSRGIDRMLEQTALNTLSNGRRKGNGIHIVSLATDGVARNAWGHLQNLEVIRTNLPEGVEVFSAPVLDTPRLVLASAGKPTYDGTLTWQVDADLNKTTKSEVLGADWPRAFALGGDLYAFRWRGRSGDGSRVAVGETSTLEPHSLS